jgi:hypothetical protein
MTVRDRPSESRASCIAVLDINRDYQLFAPIESAQCSTEEAMSPQQYVYHGAITHLGALTLYGWTPGCNTVFRRFKILVILRREKKAF